MRTTGSAAAYSGFLRHLVMQTPCGLREQLPKA